MRPARLLTDGTKAAHEIRAQLQTCTNAWVAVAWATNNPVFDELTRQESKLKRVIIGTHGYLTDPDCIERLANKNWVSFRRASGPLFHPKLYLFEHLDRFTSIVGSHNLTGAAFNRNVELSTVTEHEKASPLVKGLLDFINAESEHSLCEVPTLAFISRYRAIHELAKKQQHDLDKFYNVHVDPESERRRKAAPIYMEWDRWLDKVEDMDGHGRKHRLRTLRHLKRLLSQPGGFRSLSLEDRRRVAGLTTERPKEDADVDWHFFGDMSLTRAFGQAFARLVEQDDPVEISAAVDILPTEGPLTGSHWSAYWDALNSATEGNGSIGIGGATRLACAKRPDYFVPITSANKTRLAAILNIDRIRLNDPAMYWETVIEAIRLTPWWTSAPPSDPFDKETWDCRAAMLDAIVYAKPLGS